MNALSILGREEEAHRRDVRRAEAFTLDRFTASFPSVAPLLAPSQNLEVRVTHPGRRKPRGAKGAAPPSGELGIQNAPAPPQLTLAERMRRGLLDTAPLAQPAQEPPAAPAPPAAAAPHSATALLLSALGDASAGSTVASGPEQPPLPATQRVNGYGARGRAGFRGRGRDPYERALITSSDTSSSEDEGQYSGGIVSEVFAPSLELAQRCLVIDSGTPSTRQSLRALRSIATAAVRLTLHRDRDPALGRDVTASLFAEVVEAACARLYAAGAEHLELALTAAAPGAIAAGGSGAAPTQIVARALDAAMAAFGKGEPARASLEAARATVEECMPPFTAVCDEDEFLTRAATCVYNLTSAGLLRPAVILASDGFTQLLPGPAADCCGDVLPPFLSTSMDHTTCVVSSASEAMVPPAQSVAHTSGIDAALHTVHGYAGAPRDRLWWWDALPAVEAFRWALVGAIIAQCAQPRCTGGADQVVEVPPGCTRRWSPIAMVAKFAARRGPGEAAGIGAWKLAEIVTSSDAAVFVAGSTIALSDSALLARWAAYRVVATLLLEALVR